MSAFRLSPPNVMASIWVMPSPLFRDEGKYDGTLDVLMGVTELNQT